MQSLKSITRVVSNAQKRTLRPLSSMGTGEESPWIVAEDDLSSSTLLSLSTSFSLSPLSLESSHEPNTLFGYLLSSSDPLTFTRELSNGKAGGQWKVFGGQWFCIPIDSRESLKAEADGESIEGFGVLKRGWRGIPSIGGPIESRGRLRYIDGCRYVSEKRE